MSERLFTVTEESITDVFIATANKDGAADAPSLRTLGTGALQAAAGNHTHASSLADGDYGDVAVSSSGTVMTVESFNGGTAFGTAAGHAHGDYQPADATLSALATLGASASAGIWRQTGAATVVRVADTAVGLALLTAADAAAQRTALGLAAVAASGAAADVSGLASVATSGSASDLGTGTLPIARIATAAVVYAKIQDVTALSVVGRAANTDGVSAAIAAASDGDVLRRSGTAIGFGAIPIASVTGGAPLASPTLTGTPAAPTAAGGTNTTQIATTAFVATSFAPLASPTFTGTPAAPTAAAATNTTQLATTAFVTTADNLKANLASPALTGVPTAPVIVLATTAPSAPSAGNVAVDGISVGGRMTPAFTPPVGARTALEPSIAQSSIVEWITVGNTSSAPTALGMATPVSSGTATARNVATTNTFTMARRWGSISSTATAGSSTSLRGAALQFALQGGFSFVCRFGISDAASVANARMFVGMCATISSFANAEPSTNVNMFGIGCEAGGTTLIAYNNDGSGTATMSASLGVNFSTTTRSTDWYELAMFCAVGGSTVYYVVSRLGQTDVASGSWSSDLPSSTTLLTPQIWRNNGTTALAVGFDFGGLYIRTDT